MGCCLSSERNEYESESQTARVVSLNGDLIEYMVPVFVSQVLQDSAAVASSFSSSSSSSSSSCFVCNSDGLLFDDYIPALDWDDELQANQIYFVLPTSKLQYKLSASDMAALAVKASVAIQKHGSKKGSNRRKRARISPVLPGPSNNHIKKSNASSKAKRLDQKPLVAVSPDYNNITISRSGSVRRLQKYTSRRAKLAVRSFRLRLATIYEGIVM